MRRLLFGAFLLFGLALAAAPASAQPAPTPEATQRPARTILFGFEERFRFENWDNIVDHDKAAADVRQQWRFRTRIWARVPLGDRVSLQVGLNNESRGQNEPALPLTRDEIIFETLHVDLQATRRLSARLGRQNMMRGDGFILFDGTSGDGSRTTYVNGANVTYAFTPKARIELIAISSPWRDVYLPVVTDKRKALTEWDERLGGLYYSDTRLARTDVQAYYFYKDERHDGRPPTHPQYQSDRTVQTAGARLAREVAPGWLVTGELALQWGTAQPATPIRARGGYLTLKRSLAQDWRPTILFGYTGLSGDDPTTPTCERWNPLLSRWPKWSELYIYSLGPEAGVAYWTNIGMWQAEATVVPSSRLALRGTYYRLSAFRSMAGRSPTFATGAGRGDLVQARADFVLHPSLKGHALVEHLVPGRFYAGHDAGSFFRVEFIYTLTRSIRLDRRDDETRQR